jgi:FkbM family methyltransferase
MTGATGNIYCGLHEFSDMAFLLHLLRPGDLFVDVGANIGSYTVLASAVCGSNSISFEPDPVTVLALQRNVAVNSIETLVTVRNAAVGEMKGIVHFTIGLDTTNHVADPRDERTREVPVECLDDVLAGREPTMIKLDVEGFEAMAFAGARETLRNPSLLAIEAETCPEAVLSQLAAAGFRRCHYEPWGRTLSETPIGRHSNALFVRDWEACEQRLASAAKRMVVGHVL